MQVRQDTTCQLYDKHHHKGIDNLIGPAIVEDTEPNV